ncbi:hypothetical protein [Muricoccus vinaceus]|uniref:Uncharacterized protein n=1 Tax=Muricoccus vinaceus TaxID=424704 RepID=A0ABV6IST5_9PROT
MMHTPEISETRLAYKQAFEARQDAWKIRNAARERFIAIDSPVSRTRKPLLPDGTAVTDLGLAAAKEALALAEAAVAAAEEAERAAFNADCKTVE